MEFPLNEMKPGDSFSVSAATAERLRSAVAQAEANKFIVQTKEDGSVRVFCVTPEQFSRR